MKNRMLLFIIFVCLGFALVHAQEKIPADKDPAHDKLRAMRDVLVEAANRSDLEAMLSHVHKNVVITWQNAETNRGHEDLRSFYKRMMIGEDRVVESVTQDLKVDELSILYGGDVAVAFGDLNEEYKLTNGTQFDLHSRWTATLVKEGDRWVVASYHVSANLFDNPLLTVAKNALYLIGAIASVIGLALGVIMTIIVTKVRRKKAISTS